MSMQVVITDVQPSIVLLFGRLFEIVNFPKREWYINFGFFALVLDQLTSSTWKLTLNCKSMNPFLIE